MGGNLFKLGRVPRERYLEIEAEVRRALDEIAGDRYRIPRYYGDKADFGDLDVVLSADAFDDWEDFKAAICAALGVRRSKSTGAVFSTVYRDFQVDYFVRDPRYFLSTYNFLSFNDLGNLVGKIFRRFRLKYGERGLAYVFRRASRESYKRDIELSRDPRRIFGFLELDADAWEDGFARLEEMFDWVTASPYFSAAPYLEPSPGTRKRIRERTTLRHFVSYLQERGIDRDDIDRRRDPGELRALPRIAAAFPEADLLAAVEREEKAEADALALAEKFDGRRVASWTGLEGKALGVLMRRIHETWTREEMLAMPGDAIREAVLELHREAALEENRGSR